MKNYKDHESHTAPVNLARGTSPDATKVALDTKNPVGAVGKPEYGTYSASKEMSATLKHNGGITGTASNANLSAKFKNPQKKQEHIPADAFNQYE